MKINNTEYNMQEMVEKFIDTRPKNKAVPITLVDIYTDIEYNFKSIVEAVKWLGYKSLTNASLRAKNGIIKKNNKIYKIYKYKE